MQLTPILTTAHILDWRNFLARICTSGEIFAFALAKYLGEA